MAGATPLAPLLAGLGFECTSEHYDHASLSGAYAVFARLGAEFRLVWDGKKRALHGQWRAGDLKDWADVEQPSSVSLPFDYDIAGRIEGQVLAGTGALGEKPGF